MKRKYLGSALKDRRTRRDIGDGGQPDTGHAESRRQRRKRIARLVISSRRLDSGRLRSRIRRTVAAFVAAAAALVPEADAQTSVTTHHYDNLRTGWNYDETVLTPAIVESSAFGLLYSVPLDEQVDAQPLVVVGQSITGQIGTYNVVYVATENNTIYAIDSATGAVLLQNNFGTPVPRSVLPGRCNNNSSVVGINSTPVIDLASKTIYVVIYTLDAPNTPQFRLHALDLSSLTDKVAPVVVTASQTLVNGATYTFNRP